MARKLFADLMLRGQSSSSCGALGCTIGRSPEPGDPGEAVVAFT